MNIMDSFPLALLALLIQHTHWLGVRHTCMQTCVSGAHWSNPLQASLSLSLSHLHTLLSPCARAQANTYTHVHKHKMSTPVSIAHLAHTHARLPVCAHLLQHALLPVIFAGLLRLFLLTRRRWIRATSHSLCLPLACVCHCSTARTARTAFPLHAHALLQASAQPPTPAHPGELAAAHAHAAPATFLRAVPAAAREDPADPTMRKHGRGHRRRA